MPDPVVKLFDFSGGYIDRRTNPLDYPQNGISAGEDVSIQNKGVRTRPGTTMTSDGSLPAGEVQVSQQVRFPSNEKKYVIAQVKEAREGWTDTPPTPVVTTYWRPCATGHARAGHTATWVPSLGRMYVVGGDLWGNTPPFETPLVPTMTNISYYDPDKDAWTDIIASGGPNSYRVYHTTIYDAKRDRLIVYAGSDSWAEFLLGQGHATAWWWCEDHPAFAFDLQSNTWSELITSGAADHQHQQMFHGAGL